MFSIICIRCGNFLNGVVFPSDPQEIKVDLCPLCIEKERQDAIEEVLTAYENPAKSKEIG